MLRHGARSAWPGTGSPSFSAQVSTDLSPTNRFSTILPLMGVMLVSMIKSAIEDWRRHSADALTNNAKAKVLRSDGSVDTVRWQDIAVGDVIILHDRESCPADLILLASSDPRGSCFIQTRSIDGETNLKQRTAVSSTQGIAGPTMHQYTTVVGLSLSSTHIRSRATTVPAPRPEMHAEAEAGDGAVDTGPGGVVLDDAHSNVDVPKYNALLSKLGPALPVFSGVLKVDMPNNVLYQLNGQASVLAQPRNEYNEGVLSAMAQPTAHHEDDSEGDTLDQLQPSPLVAAATPSRSLPLPPAAGSASRRRAGDRPAKKDTLSSSATVGSRTPGEPLVQDAGQGGGGLGIVRTREAEGGVEFEYDSGLQSIDKDNMVLRGTIIRNTKLVLGVAVYTGPETKIVMNSNESPSKTSRIDSIVNGSMVAILFALVVICTLATLLASVFEQRSGADHAPYLTFLSEEVHSGRSLLGMVRQWVTALILFNNLVPISLYVTLELVRWFQARGMEADTAMCDADRNLPMVSRTSDINEDLGQVEYVFTDKTGTLTQNSMMFKMCSVGGFVYGATRMNVTVSRRAVVRGTGRTLSVGSKGSALGDSAALASPSGAGASSERSVGSGGWVAGDSGKRVHTRLRISGPQLSKSAHLASSASTPAKRSTTAGVLQLPQGSTSVTQLQSRTSTDRRARGPAPIFAVPESDSDAKALPDALPPRPRRYGSTGRVPATLSPTFSADAPASELPASAPHAVDASSGGSAGRQSGHESDGYRVTDEGFVLGEDDLDGSDDDRDQHGSSFRRGNVPVFDVEVTQDVEVISGDDTRSATSQGRSDQPQGPPVRGSDEESERSSQSLPEPGDGETSSVSSAVLSGSSRSGRHTSIPFTRQASHEAAGADSLPAASNVAAAGRSLSGVQHAQSLPHAQQAILNYCMAKYIPGGFKFFDPRLMLHLTAGDVQAEILAEYLLCCAVCHTVVAERPNSVQLGGSEGGELEYQAASPDEAALVAAARGFGFEYVDKRGDTITVNVLGISRTFTVLAVNQFTSARRMMSVLIRTPEGRTVLYCKGADQAILDRLWINNPHTVHAYQQQMEAQAMDAQAAAAAAFAAEEGTEDAAHHFRQPSVEAGSVGGTPLDAADKARQHSSVVQSMRNLLSTEGLPSAGTSVQGPARTSTLERSFSAAGGLTPTAGAGKVHGFLTTSLAGQAASGSVPSGGDQVALAASMTLAGQSEDEGKAPQPVRPSAVQLQKGIGIANRPRRGSLDAEQSAASVGATSGEATDGPPSTFQGKAPVMAMPPRTTSELDVSRSIASPSTISTPGGESLPGRAAIGSSAVGIAATRLRVDTRAGLFPDTYSDGDDVSTPVHTSSPTRGKAPATAASAAQQVVDSLEDPFSYDGVLDWELQHVALVERHLREFGLDGFRVMVMAKREISPETAEAWLSIHKDASEALVDREAKLLNAADSIESNLTMLGASAIEDKLQKGVPRTIANLARGGIRMWMLTGDKEETAVNIGVSCRLLRDDMSVLMINGQTKEECISQLAAARAELRFKNLWDPSNVNENLALVLEGRALQHLLPPDQGFSGFKSQHSGSGGSLIASIIGGVASSMCCCVGKGSSDGDAGAAYVAHDFISPRQSASPSQPSSRSRRPSRRSLMGDSVRSLQSTALRSRNSRRIVAQALARSSHNLLGMQYDEETEDAAGAESELSQFGTCELMVAWVLLFFIDLCSSCCCCCTCFNSVLGETQAPGGAAAGSASSRSVMDEMIGGSIAFFAGRKSFEDGETGSEVSDDTWGHQYGDSASQASRSQRMGSALYGQASWRSKPGAGSTFISSRSLVDVRSGSTGRGYSGSGMTGPALRTYERELLEIARQCKAVVACRLSPLQKAQVVRLVKHGVSPSPLTLAIGDGGNDVSMIQEAHVGVGISGVEGMQAVRASDFAIGQFRFLERLLLVHGRYNYQRVAFTISYSFYKNVALVLTLFCFTFFNAFSGATLYESFVGSMWNVLFTVLPVIVVGIFDEDVNPASALAYPGLYLHGQQNRKFNAGLLGNWMATAAWHAFLVFFGMYFVWLVPTIATQDGQVSSLWFSGAGVNLALVLVVNLKLMVESQVWSKVVLGAVAFSLLAWVGFVALYASLYALGLNLIDIVPFLGVGTRLLQTPTLWLSAIPVATLAVSLDAANAYYKRYSRPQLHHIVQEWAAGFPGRLSPDRVAKIIRRMLLWYTNPAAVTQELRQSAKRKRKALGLEESSDEEGESGPGDAYAHEASRLTTAAPVKVNPDIQLPFSSSRRSSSDFPTVTSASDRTTTSDMAGEASLVTGSLDFRVASHVSGTGASLPAGALAPGPFRSAGPTGLPRVPSAVVSKAGPLSVSRAQLGNHMALSRMRSMGSRMAPGLGLTTSLMDHQLPVRESSVGSPAFMGIIQSSQPVPWSEEEGTTASQPSGGDGPVMLSTQPHLPHAHDGEGATAASSVGTREQTADDLLPARSIPGTSRTTGTTGTTLQGGLSVRSPVLPAHDEVDGALSPQPQPQSSLTSAQPQAAPVILEPVPEAEHEGHVRLLSSLRGSVLRNMEQQWVDEYANKLRLEKIRELRAAESKNKRRRSSVAQLGKSIRRLFTRRNIYEDEDASPRRFGGLGGSSEFTHSKRTGTLLLSPVGAPTASKRSSTGGKAGVSSPAAGHVASPAGDAAGMFGSATGFDVSDDSSRGRAQSSPFRSASGGLQSDASRPRAVTEAAGLSQPAGAMPSTRRASDGTSTSHALDKLVDATVDDASVTTLGTSAVSEHTPSHAAPRSAKSGGTAHGTSESGGSSEGPAASEERSELASSGAEQRRKRPGVSPLVLRTHSGDSDTSGSAPIGPLSPTTGLPIKSILRKPQASSHSQGTGHSSHFAANPFDVDGYAQAAATVSPAAGKATAFAAAGAAESASSSVPECETPETSMSPAHKGNRYVRASSAASGDSQSLMGMALVTDTMTELSVSARTGLTSQGGQEPSSRPPARRHQPASQGSGIALARSGSVGPDGQHRAESVTTSARGGSMGTFRGGGTTRLTSSILRSTTLSQPSSTAKGRKASFWEDSFAIYYMTNTMHGVGGVSAGPKPLISKISQRFVNNRRLESQYQRKYFAPRGTLQLQYLLTLVHILYTGFTVFELVAGYRHPQTEELVYVSSEAASISLFFELHIFRMVSWVILIALHLLTLTKEFQRRYEVYMLLSSLSFGLLFLFLGTSELTTRVVIFLMALFLVLRVQFTHALAVGITISLVTLIMTLTNSGGDPSGGFSFAVSAILFIGFFGYSAYSSGLNMRRDFAQQGTLRLEQRRANRILSNTMPPHITQRILKGMASGWASVKPVSQAAAVTVKDSPGVGDPAPMAPVAERETALGEDSEHGESSGRRQAPPPPKRRAPPASPGSGLSVSVAGAAVDMMDDSEPVATELVTPSHRRNTSSSTFASMGRALSQPSGEKLPLASSNRTISSMRSMLGQSSRATNRKSRPRDPKAPPLALFVDEEPAVSVLFVDLQDFPVIVQRHTPSQLVGVLDSLYSLFDVLASKHRVYKVESVGKTWMAAAGLSQSRPDHAAACINLALDILDHIVQIRNIHGEQSFHVKVGVNSGALVTGVVGLKKPQFCLFGDTVNTASRMQSTGVYNRVHISPSTQSEVQGLYELEPRKVQVKGKGEMSTYLVRGPVDGPLPTHVQRMDQKQEAERAKAQLESTLVDTARSSVGTGGVASGRLQKSPVRLPRQGLAGFGTVEEDAPAPKHFTAALRIDTGSTVRGADKAPRSESYEGVDLSDSKGLAPLGVAGGSPARRRVHSSSGPGGDSPAHSCETPAGDESASLKIKHLPGFVGTPVASDSTGPGTPPHATGADKQSMVPIESPLARPMHGLHFSGRKASRDLTPSAQSGISAPFALPPTHTPLQHAATIGTASVPRGAGGGASGRSRHSAATLMMAGSTLGAGSSVTMPGPARPRPSYRRASIGLAATAGRIGTAESTGTSPKSGLSSDQEQDIATQAQQFLKEKQRAWKKDEEAQLEKNLQNMAERVEMRPLLQTFKDPELDAAYWLATTAKRVRRTRVVVAFLAFLFFYRAVEEALAAEADLSIRTVGLRLIFTGIGLVFLFASSRMRHQAVRGTVPQWFWLLSYIMMVLGGCVLVATQTTLPIATMDIMLFCTLSSNGRMLSVLTSTMLNAAVVVASTVVGFTPTASTTLSIDIEKDGWQLVFYWYAALAITAMSASSTEYYMRRGFGLGVLTREQTAYAERLLYQMLPRAAVSQLKEGRTGVSDSYRGVTLLFMDLCGFTKMSAALRPAQVVSMLNALFTEFDQLTDKYRVMKVQTIGDAYIAVAGLPFDDTMSGTWASQAAPQSSLGPPPPLSGRPEVYSGRLPSTRRKPRPLARAGTFSSMRSQDSSRPISPAPAPPASPSSGGQPGGSLVDYSAMARDMTAEERGMVQASQLRSLSIAHSMPAREGSSHSDTSQHQAASGDAFTMSQASLDSPVRAMRTDRARRLSRLQTLTSVRDLSNARTRDTARSAGVATARAGQLDDVKKNAETMLKMALSMQKAVKRVTNPATGQPLKMRVGLHTGNIIAGVIGTRTLRYDMWGADVLAANLMESHAEHDGILVSEVTRDALQHVPGIQFEAGDRVDVSGMGELNTFHVRGNLHRLI